MVTRSPCTRGGRRTAGLLAVLCGSLGAGCASSGADVNGPRDPHDATSTPGATPAPVHDGRAARRTLGWVSLAVGAEAAIVAVVTSGILVHDKDVLDAQCNAQKLCSPAGVNAAGTISSVTPWNTGAWIAAAAGLGAGTILLLTNRPDAPGATAITVSPEGSAPGVGLRGQF